LIVRVGGNGFVRRRREVEDVGDEFDGKEGRHGVRTEDSETGCANGCSKSARLKRKRWKKRTWKRREEEGNERGWLKSL
jgi:hypothetical protein